MPAAPMSKLQNISKVGFATLLKYSTDALTNERTTLCLPDHATGLSLWLDLADPSACLVFPQHELYGRTTAVNVKRLLPPRQSRGTSHGTLGCSWVIRAVVKLSQRKFYFATTLRTNPQGLDIAWMRPEVHRLCRAPVTTAAERRPVREVVGNKSLAMTKIQIRCHAPGHSIRCSH
jgi:hypothetical protein